MQQELTKEAIQGISRAFQALKLYPMQHPNVRKQLQDCLTALSRMFLEKHLVKMGLLDGTLFFDEDLFAFPSPAEQELINMLQKLETDGLEWLIGLTAEELLQFFRIIQENKCKGEDLQEAFTAAGIHHIRPINMEPPEEDELRPKKVYNRALKVLDHIFQDVRVGQIPNSEEAIEVVKDLAELTLAEPDALFALSLIKDYDNYTFTHSVNVSVLALMVGRACGLTMEQLRVLGLGGLLHDIGKLKVNLEIITKPGRLNRKEFEEIKKHPINGAEMAKQMENVPQEVIDIILCHHLHYNRQGYPAEVKERKLSPLVDMATIADTYDAMTTLRSYQRPVSPRMAIAKLESRAGNILHPTYIKKFIESLGPYPVGTLVRLDNNEISLVTRVNVEEQGDLQIKTLFDPSGKLLGNPIESILPESSLHRIVAEVDPFIKGIEVSNYLEQGN